MGPITAYLYVTLRCNARCVFCNVWREQASAVPDMPAQLGVRLLTDLRRLGVRHVDFTGGEPLLYEPLPQLLTHARELGLFTSVTSNGLLYRQRADELNGQLYSLGFSLNGATAEVHDSIQGVRSFEKTISSLQLARAMGEPVHAHCTASDLTIDALDAIHDLTTRLRVPLVVFPEFSYFGNRQLTQSHLDRLRLLARQDTVCVNLASVRFQQDGGNNTRHPICSAGRSALAVAPDGSLVLPCFHKRQHQIQTNGDLLKAYRSEEVRRLLDWSGRYPFCEGCTNWCYINPSFARRLCKYTLPHVAAAVKRMRVAQGGSGARRTGQVLWRGAVASVRARSARK